MTTDKTITPVVIKCGYVFVEIVASAYGQTPSIILASPSSTDENGFEPAQSVHIYGEEPIKKLRDSIDYMLKQIEDFKEQQQKVKV